MKRSLTLLTTAILLVSQGGCAGLKYEQAYKDGNTVVNDPSSPPQGGFAFSLRTSTVLVATSSASSPQKPPTPYQCFDPKAAKESDLSTKDCLRGITETAAPVSDMTAVYFAEPLSTHSFWLWSTWGGTQMTPKADANDPMMIDSVSFTYNNKVAGIVTAAGTGAAAGFVYGPWGAVAGGFIGAVGAVTPYYSAEVNLPPALSRGQNEPLEAVCSDQDDQDAYKAASNATPPLPKQLLLPVSLQYHSVYTDSPCWHAFPTPINTIGEKNTGWFYRMTAETTPPLVRQSTPPILFQGDLDRIKKSEPSGDELNKFPFHTTAYFFGSSNASSAETTFPVSACVSVRVQIAWWKDIESGAADSLAAVTLAMADPNVVQVLNWSDGTSITLLPCGAYASTGAPSTPIADDVSAMVKQAQAIQSAQQQWKKGK